MALDSKVPQGPLKDKWTDYKNHINLVNPANKRHIDVIVVGTGLAGGSASATLAELGFAGLIAAKLAPFALIGFALPFNGVAPLTGKVTFFKLNPYIGVPVAESCPIYSSLTISSETYRPLKSSSSRS